MTQFDSTNKDATSQKNKPKQTLAGQVCPICHNGVFELLKIEHKEECGEAPEISLQVWVDRCRSCHETVYSSETMRYIQAFIADESEQLSKHELELIRKTLGVDQTEMSEILGLGSKSYHRWERGAQYPSRSMGYYIRILAEFPETFKWLQARAWRKKKRTSKIDENDGGGFIFPALERQKILPGARRINLAHAPPEANYAEAFSTISIK